MYLLVCAVEKEIAKYELNHLLQENSLVQNALWLNGENAKEVQESDSGFAIGSIASLFMGREKSVLMAKIKGKDTVERVLKSIKAYSGQMKSEDYFIVHLVA